LLLAQSRPAVRSQPQRGTAIIVITTTIIATTAIIITITIIATMPTILATTIIGIGIATKRSFEAANFEVALGGLLFRVIDFADLRRGSPRQINAAIACPVRPCLWHKANIEDRGPAM